MKIWILSALCVITSFSLCFQAKAESLQNFKLHRGDGQYNRPVQFVAKKQVSFPDFSLLPLGSRYVPMSVEDSNSECCHFHDFKLRKGSSSKTITWSELNLEKNPLVFRFGRDAYVLYMQKVGDRKLGEDEIVILKFPK